jgi:hypothetical protein
MEQEVSASLERLQVVEQGGASCRSPGGGAAVCVDLGYKWPSEARPAKERQGAVATQLANFVGVVTQKDGADFRVRVCGQGTAAILPKLEALAPVVEVDPNDLFDSLLSADRDEDVIYLSPDADEFLDTTQGWPFRSERRVVFVVGGIVDRKVKRGRSAKRAEEARAQGRTVRAAQLPLAAQDTGAPLNIDTVLTMLFYWWAFDEKSRAAESSYPRSVRSNGLDDGTRPRSAGADADTAPSENAGVKVGCTFAAARHCAMFEHRQRHPQQGKHIL